MSGRSDRPRRARSPRRSSGRRNRRHPIETMRLAVPPGNVGTPYPREDNMWWIVGGLGAILYLVLLVAVGVSCLRKGHWVMFVAGIFMPLFWIIGAVIPPTRPQLT